MKKLKKLTMFFISQFLVLFFVIPVWGGGDTGVEKLFVVTTDYSTGSYSTVNLTDWSADSSIGSIHSDAIAQYYRGKIYVINRLYGDNIMVFSTADLTSPILQFSTGALSNPYYMAFLNEEKAYVTLYEETDLLVVNPSTGAEITRIDLSSYADADGIPEMSSMVMLNGKLFVAIQRLDRNNFLSPTDYSQVVVVDTQTDTVLQSVTLTGKNPIAMSYNPVM
ncbi:MAG: hypothetical protein SV062_11750, partial [Thermodesulfobacteriota bacterium]|nr:hypothetical protein [Thermodesulfobacteriota bacterium]